MKKSILVLATLGLFYTGYGQDIVVESALTALKSGNYDEAKENIDRAMAYPGTKEKPKALYAKSRIYMQIQLEKVPKYIASNPYREAAQALMKLAEINPTYEKAAVDLTLFNCAIFYNNDGVNAFNNKNTKEGVECMLNIVKIHDLNAGKRFEKYTNDKFPVKKLDTFSANANASAAVSYLIDKNYNEAVPLLIKVVNNSITKTAGNYNYLVESYSFLGKEKELFETIAEGRKFFPTDNTLKHNELYYYYKFGKQDQLLKKLEDVANNEPENAEFQYNLAVAYLDMISNKDSTKKANKEEYLKKSENAFQKAIAKDPNNVNYNYNFGVLYYEQGKDANEIMNALADKINEKGNKTQKEDQKQYDQQKSIRDQNFTKSLTYFEQIANQYSAKTTGLSKEENAIYKNCLSALKDAYTILGKNDKYKEVKVKLDALEDVK